MAWAEPAASAWTRKVCGSARCVAEVGQGLAGGIPGGDRGRGPGVGLPGVLAGQVPLQFGVVQPFRRRVHVPRAAARDGQPHIKPVFQQLDDPAPHRLLQVSGRGAGLRGIDLLLGGLQGGRSPRNLHVEIVRRVDQRHGVLPGRGCRVARGLCLLYAGSGHGQIGFARAGLQQRRLRFGDCLGGPRLGDLGVQQGRIHFGDQVAAGNLLAFGDVQRGDPAAGRAGDVEGGSFDGAGRDECHFGFRISDFGLPIADG